MEEKVTLEKLNTKLDSIETLVKETSIDLKEFIELKIDQLALSTARGFDEVHSDIRNFKREVNERFDDVEHRLDKLESANSTVTP